MKFRLVKIILVVVAAFSFSTVAFAQHQKIRCGGANIRIVKDKPTVYITFERFAARKAVHNGESDEGVYLWLHNNTRWALVLEAHGAGDKALAKGTEDEIGMFYGFEEVPTSIETTSSFDPPDPRISSRMSDTEAKALIEAHKYDYCVVPISYSCHFCSVIQLPPGKSLLFSLPRETLGGNLKTYISYQYDWEGDWPFGSEPEHRVYFYGLELPNGADKK